MKGFALQIISAEKRIFPAVISPQPSILSLLRLDSAQNHRIQSKSSGIQTETADTSIASHSDGLKSAGGMSGVFFLFVLTTFASFLPRNAVH